ncbi:MAG: FkbM family methyltransferase [Pseudomonadota bacterium]
MKSFLHKQVHNGAVASLAQNDNSLEELLAYKFKSETFEVQLRRLSDIIKENQVEHIDLLKINVEKSV